MSKMSELDIINQELTAIKQLLIKKNIITQEEIDGQILEGHCSCCSDRALESQNDK